MNYTCDGLKEFKRNINLKSPVSIARNSDEDYFGGKRKSRRKTNRRTSRRKTNRRKTTRRRKTKKYKK
jgi:hypothetical protein